MSCGYDPFKWADIYTSEEEYIKDLENDAQNNQNQQSDGLVTEQD